jgi:hypothetical protein
METNSHFTNTDSKHSNYFCYYYSRLNFLYLNSNNVLIISFLDNSPPTFSLDLNTFLYYFQIYLHLDLAIAIIKTFLVFLLKYYYCLFASISLDSINYFSKKDSINLFPFFFPISFFFSHTKINILLLIFSIFIFYNFQFF